MVWGVLATYGNVAIISVKCLYASRPLAAFKSLTSSLPVSLRTSAIEYVLSCVHLMRSTRLTGFSTDSTIYTSVNRHSGFL